MLDALVGGVDVVADRRADAGELAGGDARADAGAADQHAALGVAGEDRLADLARLVRIVDSHGVGVRPEVDDVVTERRELLEHALPQLDAAVVERDGHPHTASYVTHMDDAQLWRELGQQFRVDSVRCAAAAKSGHPTSGMSAADLMAVLLAKYLRYDFDAPGRPANDRLVFSKGHASTLLYAMFKAAGAISDEELMTLPPVRIRSSRGTRHRAFPGSTSPRARSARGCRSVSGWRSPASASTACRTASGCSAATARRPRARSGRRSSTRGTTSSTT